jgi:hypothetical protein
MTKQTRKTVKKHSSDDCHKVTMHALHEWYEAEFEKLGWMILAKHHGFTEKITTYKMALQHLKKALECKLKLLHEADRKADVKIMWDNLCLLIEHVDKDFA